jgi:hypothetical protein
VVLTLGRSVHLPQHLLRQSLRHPPDGDLDVGDGVSALLDLLRQRRDVPIGRVVPENRCR